MSRFKSVPNQLRIVLTTSKMNWFPTQWPSVCSCPTWLGQKKRGASTSQSMNGLKVFSRRWKLSCHCSCKTLIGSCTSVLKKTKWPSSGAPRKWTIYMTRPAWTAQKKPRNCFLPSRMTSKWTRKDRLANWPKFKRECKLKSKSSLLSWCLKQNRRQANLKRMFNLSNNRRFSSLNKFKRFRENRLILALLLKKMSAKSNGS
jgi:hypothetical protein